MDQSEAGRGGVSAGLRGRAMLLRFSAEIHLVAENLSTIPNCPAVSANGKQFVELYNSSNSRRTAPPTGTVRPPQMAIMVAKKKTCQKGAFLLLCCRRHGDASRSAVAMATVEREGGHQPIRARAALGVA